MPAKLFQICYMTITSPVHSLLPCRNLKADIRLLGRECLVSALSSKPGRHGITKRGKPAPAIQTPLFRWEQCRLIELFDLRHPLGERLPLSPQTIYREANVNVRGCTMISIPAHKS
jgi:hypothetical protein